MVLTDEQILAYCKNPQNKTSIDAGKELQEAHRLHICPTEKQYKDSLEQIIGYENVQQFGLKQELSEPVTKYLTKHLKSEQGRWKHVPVSRVYQFKGSEEKSQVFEDEILSKAWNNKSLTSFITSFFADALYTDFDGFCMVEQARIETDEEGQVYQIKEGVKTKSTNPTDNPQPYIIFKCLDDVIDYQCKGDKVEYLIIELTEDEKGNEWYRCIDDARDVVVKHDVENGGIYKIDEAYPIIINQLGYVPAIQVSNIQADILDYQVKTSPIDACIPHLKLFLTNYAEHVMSCILHAHPIYYQVGQKCGYVTTNGVKCEGGYLQYLDNESHNETICPQCKGTGHNIHRDSSTVIILPAKDEEGKPANFNNVAGYVTPPIEILKHQIDELNYIEQKIYFCGTGIQGLTEDSIAKTATETMLNLKPLENIIDSIITNIELVETFLTDCIGKLFYKESYIKSQINYSRRLNLKDENTVVTELKDAKANGCSFGYIKTLVEEIIYSRYQNSPIDLQRNLILLELEPLPGWTYTEIKDDSLIPNETKIFKLMFNDLIQQWEEVNGDIYNYFYKNDNKNIDQKKVIAKIREQLKVLLEDYLPDEPTDNNQMEPVLDEKGQPMMNADGSPMMKPNIGSK